MAAPGGRAVRGAPGRVRPGDGRRPGCPKMSHFVTSRKDVIRPAASRTLERPCAAPPSLVAGRAAGYCVPGVAPPPPAVSGRGSRAGFLFPGGPPAAPHPGPVMNVIYAPEPLPDRVTHTLFLLGPTPRGPAAASWRPEALRILTGLGFGGDVFV